MFAVNQCLEKTKRNFIDKGLSTGSQSERLTLHFLNVGSTLQIAPHTITQVNQENRMQSRANYAPALPLAHDTGELLNSINTFLDSSKVSYIKEMLGGFLLDYFDYQEEKGEITPKHQVDVLSMYEALRTLLDALEMYQVQMFNKQITMT